MSESMKRIANKLRNLRLDRKLSAEAMAVEIGVSPASIWRFEEGKNMSKSMVEKYCDYFDVELVINAR